MIEDKLSLRVLRNFGAHITCTKYVRESCLVMDRSDINLKRRKEEEFSMKTLEYKRDLYKRHEVFYRVKTLIDVYKRFPLFTFYLQGITSQTTSLYTDCNQPIGLFIILC